MKRAEAERAMEEGREVLRLRSPNDPFGTRVVITGIGYGKVRYGRNAGTPVLGGNGVRCSVLGSGGEVTYETVFPLSQLHLSTQAERRNRRDQTLRQQREAEQAAREQHSVDMGQARVLAAALGGTAQTKPYSGVVVIELSLPRAAELIIDLQLSTGDATVVSPTTRKEP